ncbi:MAG: rhodanese-like domain-containing protein [Planctomycetota bacterium]
MSFENLSPRESSARIREGWTYLDVRTVAEFEQGHAAGAFNVPFVFRNPGSPPTPNPEFLATVKRHFAKDSRLVLG